MEQKCSGKRSSSWLGLFVCELYSNSNVFTRLLFTRYKAKLNIHVGRTIFKTKLDLSSVLNKVITSMPGPAMQKPATGETAYSGARFSIHLLHPLYKQKTESRTTLINKHNGRVPGHRHNIYKVHNQI